MDLLRKNADLLGFFKTFEKVIKAIRGNLRSEVQRHPCSTDKVNLK